MNKKSFSWIGQEIVSRSEIETVIKQLAAQIDADYQHLSEELVAIGIMRGGFIFLSDLVKELQTAVDIDFITTRSYGKSTTSSGELELLADLQVDIKGKHVLIVDDIVDTGQTLMFLDNILKNREPASINYCCLMDKPERRHPDFNLQVKYLGLRVPNVFLMGYGLDGKHFGRNLTEVYSLAEES